MAEITASSQISALASQVGSDIKSILGSIGTLSDLTTTQKASLVVAINELKAALGTIDLTAIIDDTKTVINQTQSSSKINNAISAAVTNLVNGAPETMDTLKELADLIDTNKDAISALQSLAAGHVKYDGAQSLTTAQQTQARTNIGAASATELASVKTTAEKGVSDAAAAKSTADSALSAANTAQSTANTAVSNAATAQSKADAVGTELTNFKAEVGSTSTDYVAVYTAARDGTV